MADITHTLQVKAPLKDIFHAVSTPEGLDAWWTDRCSGTPGEGEIFSLGFSEEYNWKARMTEYSPDELVRYEITEADKDWEGTRIEFLLRKESHSISIQFSHTGWDEVNDHFRTSSYCWAMYLRILKRYLELGEFVPYDERNLT